MKKIFAVLVGAMLLSGCTQRLVDFTIISSKNVPITEEGTKLRNAEKRVKGEDSKVTVLCFGAMPNMKEAIDKAIEKYPGAVALTDGVVKGKAWTCFLFGKRKYIVEGVPLYAVYDNQQGSGSAKIPAASQNSFYTSSNVMPQQEVSAGNQTTVVDAQQEQQPSSVIRILHTVEKGETLPGIAKTYGVTVVKIMKWNNLTSNKLTPSQKLTIYVSEL